MQLREYIDDTEDYINIQVLDSSILNFYGNILKFSDITCASIFQLDNHRNQLIQVLFSSYAVYLITMLDYFLLFIFSFLNLEYLYSVLCKTCFLFSSRFMVQLELFLSAGTLCMAIFSLVAGIFGMNIPYTWNDGYGYMFKWVCKAFLLAILSSMTLMNMSEIESF